MDRQYPRGYRNNHRAVLDSPTLSSALFEAVRAVLPAVWVDQHGTRWRLTGLNPRFRACRYAPGESFRVHRDGAQATGTTRTFRTLMLYLNGTGAFSGGRTRFYATQVPERPEVVLDPVAGMAAVFPHNAWHDGETVTAGHKYVLRTDLIYERCAPATAINSHSGYVWDVAVCGDQLASVGRDGRLLLWSVSQPDQTPRSITVGGGSLTAVAGLSDRRIVAGDRRGGLTLIDGQNVERDWAAVGGAVLGLHPHGDGMLVADASGCVTAMDPTGKMRATFVAPRTCDGSAPWVWAMTVMGDTVWVGDDSGITELHWPDTAGEPTLKRRIPTQGRVRALSAGTTGELAVGLDDGAVLRIGQAATSIGRHAASVRSVAWLDDATIVSGGEDSKVRTWGAAGPGPVFPHDDFVTRVAIAGPRTVVSASYDESVRRWTVPEASARE